MRMSRKAMHSVMIVGITLMVASGAAYACVAFKGKMTVTAPTSGNAVTGNEGQHTYCTLGNPVTSSKAGRGDVVTIDVAAATLCSSSTNQLTTGINKVIINNATTDAGDTFSYDGVQWNFVNGNGCFANPPGNITLGNLTVSSTGSGSASFTLPAMNRVDPSTYASGLCVGSSVTSIGIIAPLQVTAI